MDFKRIVTHMNDHHQDDMIALCKKFGGEKEVTDVKLINVDFGGLDFDYNDGKKIRIEFPQPVNESSIKQAIVSLCLESKATTNYDRVKAKIDEFRQSVKSCVLATLNEEGAPIASYAPIICLDGKNYIYISAVAEHYENLKRNPNQVEVMFLEDESQAKSIIVRTRLRYKATARFIPRADPIVEKALDKLAETMDDVGGIKTIRDFTDFDLIELTFGSGRFVRGFGQAYSILPNGDISHIGVKGNPHERASAVNLN
ncbi:HugZ family heme oxygenase [Rodentibacter genomosp. 1]|uniref:HugZ family heme oxygenase n=1 Tax=Rodentibacter genomosp. 1 TaxID=1908264 RepID=A0A1V3J1W9_9PAST|nr:HugZ family heme oxygenase [Rodentibacter genomosp. 1]OOF48845.1 HugZ family heme oxygenase [Rodentibacter genomosp. 1]